MTYVTYTYTGLVGAGNANLFKSVKAGNDMNKWHFVYFGYSRKERRAAGFVQFEGRKEEVNFPDTNHFLNRNYYIYIGKDKFYPAYNGKIASFRVLLCNGAFNP